ncbi:MAG: ribosome biogenesis GTP-binding protein YihA/YsxC [Prevotellamassilia sp.]|nr:ribosome biogenesis GTP-binding protein YihA/YsxC [Prevotellamassilia sp.]
MQIKQAEFVVSNADYKKCPDHDKPEFAFVGRSNVGKSSLINMLTGRKALAMTSSTPGKTMLINHFLINDSWYLVDLPGYGYAQRGKKAMEQLRHLISSYVALREQLTCLFVLIDSRLEPQKIDLEFIHFLGENGVPFALIFTKSDKTKRSQLGGNVARFLNALKKEWDELPPHFVTSSADRSGRDEVLDYIDQINESLKSKD